MSLYTVILHHHVLKARPLKAFFDLRTRLGPSTSTVHRLTELVPILNNFSFDGEESFRKASHATLE